MCHPNIAGSRQEIQADLGIWCKILTERLNHLVERGVRERRPYDRRPRYEYVLAEKGAELVDLLMTMVAWGDKWLAGEAGPPVLYHHHPCGKLSRATCAVHSAESRCAPATSSCLPGPAPQRDPRAVRPSGSAAPTGTPP